MSDRTMKPTPRRRKEARQQGRVAASRLLVGAAVWLGLFLLMGVFGLSALSGAREATAELWRSPVSLEGEDLTDFTVASAAVAKIVVPFLCVTFLIAIAARLAQVGVLWVPDRVLPKSDRLQPMARLGDMFSTERLYGALRSGLFVAALTATVCLGIWTERESIAQLMLVPDVGRAAVRFVTDWGLLVGAALLAIGMLDYAFERYRFEQSLHMTPEQYRTEIQAIQPNPQIGAGRRRIQESLRQPQENRSPAH